MLVFWEKQNTDQTRFHGFVPKVPNHDVQRNNMQLWVSAPQRRSQTIHLEPVDLQLYSSKQDILLVHQLSGAGDGDLSFARSLAKLYGGKRITY